MERNRIWAGITVIGILLVGAGLAAPRVWPGAAVSRFYAVPLAAGCLALLAALYGSFPGVREFLGKRSSRWGVGTGALVLVVATAVVVIQVIAGDHHKRWDVTRGGRNSLAPQTLQVLDNLKDPVEAMLFVAPGEGEDAKALLERFGYRTGRFTWRVVDPDREPSLRERHGVTTYGTVVIENRANGKKETLTGAQEERVANALVRITRAKPMTIGWITGHGEGDPSSSGREGYSLLADALRNQGYGITTLGPFTAAIPEGLSVLVAAGPMKPFLPEELQALSQWMHGGGRLLLLTEPGGDMGLASLLANYGIVAKDDLIVDPGVRILGASGDMPVITGWEEHPIVSSFDTTMAVFLPAARSLDALPGTAAKVVATTSSSSWGETDRGMLAEGRAAYDEGRDRKGPLPVIVVSTAAAEGEGEPGKEPESRIAVFGDSDLASNGYVNLSGNGDLVQNAVAWLAEESDLISIRAKDEAGTPILVTRSQGWLIALTALVGVPGLCLAAGVSVWLRRRRLR